MSDTVFIVWVRNSARAQDIAAAFQPPMDLWTIEARRLKTFSFLVPLRYLEQARVTWKRLYTEKPRAVFVQSPPIFASLVVALYAQRTGARWIVDLHSSPFNSKKWRWSLPLQRWLARRATATLVHGALVLARTRGWQGLVLNSAEPPPSIRLGSSASRDKRFRVQVISSFSFDEPLDVVLGAARQLPDVAFHITGDSTRVSPALLARKPINVTFTGFLSRADYFSEMASAHAVMVLTKRPDAMQLGAWEAMYLGQPLILSDHPQLRQYYARGAIFVSNTVEGIVAGVRRMRVEEDQKRAEIQILAAQKRQLWQTHLAELQALIAPPTSTNAPSYVDDDNAKTKMGDVLSA